MTSRCSTRVLGTRYSDLHSTPTNAGPPLEGSLRETIVHALLGAVCQSWYFVRRTKYCSVLALLLLTAGREAHSQPAPYHTYRTLETPHFRVHVVRELESQGRVVAAAAERAYALLSRELVPPRGIVDVVVSNDADYSNGSATMFPSNRIVVFVHPPLENEQLRVDEDWLTLVVTHELAHVFHLDRSRGFWSAAQRVFGRAPFLFPNAYSPSWLIEGLAVWYESRLTEGGRLRGTQHGLLARAGAREHRLLRLDQLSLASPGFPGGDAAYAYGSLLIDYLARTRGDSSVARFIESQSAQLIPILLNRGAVRGFGVSFTSAFAAWRDSVQRSTDTATAPLPGWRELTGRSLHPPTPRWIDDTTLVYSATDGRDINAAYTITTGGSRVRLGRRDGTGANVPMRDGSLVYAALDYTTPAEVRSDLYRQWPDGRVSRLTYGASLSQPDVRADGRVIAVQSGANTSALVMMSLDGTVGPRLRGGADGETWSEPRWSPDGTRLVAVHRQGDDSYRLVMLALGASGTSGEGVVATQLDRGSHLIASPSWTPDGRQIMYVSEESGTPRLATARVPSAGQAGGRLRDRQTAAPSPGIFRPELSPDGRTIAAVSLRADGYRLGIAATEMLAVTGEGETLAESPGLDSTVAPRAAGEFREYSAWRTVLPRYWYPIIESGASSGLRLGATTSGYDALGRHSYTAYGTVPTANEGFAGGVFYRFAGLRRPLLDVAVYQEWTSLGGISGAGGARVGTLLRRIRDVSVAATFVRPRVRTFSSVSMGLGVERRDWATDPAALLVQLDTGFARADDYPRAHVGASWGNARRPPLSISPEDGIAVGMTVRERLRADAPSVTASTSVVASATGYRSLDLPGFAHHVLALRLAGGWADRRSATALEVGGVSGNVVEIIPGYTVGEGRRTFGVRGFETGAVYGTRAATGSLEYRAPLALGGRGLGLLPFFFDRSSITAFGDAGVADCGADQLYPTVCVPVPRLGRVIASAGAELGISAAVLEWDAPQAIRVGVAVPVAGRNITGAGQVTAYLAFGLSY